MLNSTLSCLFVFIWHDNKTTHVNAFGFSYFRDVWNENFCVSFFFVEKRSESNFMTRVSDDIDFPAHQVDVLEFATRLIDVSQKSQENMCPFESSKSPHNDK